jgi:hypothetical protein
VRCAGLVVAVEGVAAVGVGVATFVRALAGAHQYLVYGLGTAVWFVLTGGVLLAAGRALWTGRRWGRGVAVVFQLLLLPVTWYLIRGSQLAYAIPVGVAAIGTLALLFNPAALRWVSGADPPADPTADAPADPPANPTADLTADPTTDKTIGETQDPASSDSARPETR